MAYDELKSSGITEVTPKNIMLGAGTIHKGFHLGEDGKWNFNESLIGATSGGSKVEIKPDVKDLDVDGALVAVKGLRVKVGEKATIEVNFIEMTPDLLKMVTIGEVSAEAEGYSGYSEITSKAQIEEGDYIENFAFVGKKTDGTPIIVIFDQCICTSGLSVDPKNKEAGTFTGVFECVADVSPDCDTLPWHILYPKAQG